MDALFRAVGIFVDFLGAIAWGSLALALLCHLAKTVARTRSWRNILAASYPEANVRWRSVFGAYVAGVGVNAALPARGGDLLKLYLVRHRIEGSTYPTLAATLVVETLFDFAVAAALVAWALSIGVLPGLEAVPSLPSVDVLWLFHHPRVGAVVVGALVAGAALLVIWASRRVRAFRRRVAQGFAILSPPSRYLRAVVPWQALDWAFRLATIFFFLRAFGLAADLRSALLVQVSQSLATILPLTPAGIGTEQALLVYVLRGQLGATALLSFSVGMKLVLIVANVAVGSAAILVMLRTLRWRRVVEPGSAPFSRGGAP